MSCANRFMHYLYPLILLPELTLDVTIFHTLFLDEEAQPLLISCVISGCYFQFTADYNSQPQNAESCTLNCQISSHVCFSNAKSNSAVPSVFLCISNVSQPCDSTRFGTVWYPNLYYVYMCAHTVSFYQAPVKIFSFCMPGTLPSTSGSFLGILQYF